MLQLVTILTAAVCLFTISAIRTYKHGKRFLVVSHSFSSRKLYHRASNAKPHFQNEPNIDFNTKKQICEDITGSYLFRRRGEYQYENYLGGLVRWLESFSYQTTLIPISIDQWNGKVKDEVVFVCLVRYGMLRNRYKTYYISEEYNLKAESDGPTFGENYIAGRFIFSNFRKRIRVYGLAETPGEAFVSPDYDIERLYLQRREVNSVARSRDLDNLCRLEIDDRQRICVAVFNTTYFEEEITFSNAIRPHTAYTCALENVSFQTDYGKGEVAKYELKEWMLDCRGENKFRYMLSHAYMSDQIFVYIRDETDDIFPENITTLVRLAMSSRNVHIGLTDEVAQDYKRIKYST